ncbi:MAG: methyltransferase [Aquificae bacterium]|nr:methyltransferase [Aquificota bacterium]
MPETIALAQNPYVRAFKKLRVSKLFEERPEFRKLRRKNTFWKEITEAMAIRERIRDFLIKNPDAVVIDACSGKGFLTTLIALMHPKTRVISVDIDTNAERSHLNFLKNVRFVNADIMSEDFEKLVKEAGEKVVLVGSHLCRELSERFARITNTCKNVKLGVLMPCCEGDFPRERYQFLIDELGVYEAWCYYLKDLFSPELRVKMKRDKKVISPKNILITAERT